MVFDIHDTFKTIKSSTNFTSYQFLMSKYNDMKEDASRTV